MTWRAIITPAVEQQGERLVDVAKFRKSAVTREASSPLVEAEVRSRAEAVGAGESDAEPRQ